MNSVKVLGSFCAHYSSLIRFSGIQTFFLEPYNIKLLASSTKPKHGSKHKLDFQLYGMRPLVFQYIDNTVLRLEG